MTSTTPAELTAIKEDLIAKGVKYCIGAYVDIHGVPKGKVVPVNHFENFAQGSELYTGYALDGLGQRPNDDELSSVPDLSRGVQLPWQPEVMWYPADLAFHGQPYEVSTRVAFGRVLEQARSMGFGFNLGIECEVYFVKQEEGRLVVPNPDDNLMKSCYDVKRFMDVYGLVDRIATTINGLGWDLYSLDHEDGNSQFEFDFKFSDGLTMADRYVFFRFLAKKLAADAGLLATFMPKPFADKTGNGAHFNMSLSDLETGRNLFKAATGEPDAYGLGLTSLGYSFIAGILRHGRALCAAFAPTVNSYKRLIRRGAMGYYSWAPVFNSFGTNNRTNSVRVPMAGGRCESRNADSSCNPYLAGALVLAAGLEGVREGLMPGQPQTENLYELTDEQLAERGVQALPRTLAEAVQAFEDDPFTEQVLGSALKKEFIECKRAEWEEYHLTISPWEVQKYASLF
ncbi:type III glutamate--ammonia ligase [Verrucomicrobium sp. BvORR034]|uniref:type III glutamate--ammonia ligase n=1 Tax=Verrucomicrobium sp. BvORR034 TaxID=1396418 RepID=UPI000679B54A|nr:type III glutamate--ammonia ligase [Verrucomicrobium sp. BvORR034]